MEQTTGEYQLNAEPTAWAEFAELSGRFLLLFNPCVSYVNSGVIAVSRRIGYIWVLLRSLFRMRLSLRELF